MRGSRPAPRHASRSAAPASIRAVAKLVLEQLTPLAIETSLAVSTELAQRAADADRIRQMGVKRAEHAAEAARRRYLAVDPTNRLVADQLEADWNNKLRELADARDEYDRATHAGKRPLTDQQQAQIRALATNLPALWANPATPMRERKRLIRLLVTDVTLNKTNDQIARARPPLRRPTAHATGATATAGVGGAHHATRHDRADRPTAQRSHLRRDGRGSSTSAG